MAYFLDTADFDENDYAVDRPDPDTLDLAETEHERVDDQNEAADSYVAHHDVAELDDDVEYFGDDIDAPANDPLGREAEAARDFIQRVLAYFNMDPTIDVYWDDEYLHLDIDGDDCGAIIGHRGETMNALQYLTSVAVNRVADHHVRVIVDVSGYRRRRQASLEKMARRYAGEVTKRQAEYVMEPMPASERRIIHFALQNFPGVTTESEGVEPNRCVVIIPTGAEE